MEFELKSGQEVRILRADPRKKNIIVGMTYDVISVANHYFTIRGFAGNHVDLPLNTISKGWVQILNQQNSNKVDKKYLIEVFTRHIQQIDSMILLGTISKEMGNKDINLLQEKFLKDIL